MAANALVVRNVQLPRSQSGHRAAQYVRMSTDKQRYSIQNQAAVIGAYAHAHDLTIVRTYPDEGESGLQLKNRPGLKQLLDDVSSGHADFAHVLVYDVSRWGRFQDVDESAYYEYVCKKAGIKVAYCAEQFDNDGSMLSSIVKNLKRVMAAEYSRELSVKVHAGVCRFVRMGFRFGAPTGYALRRELVDEKLQSKGVLNDGDRKYLITDHVRLRPGAADEVRVVRWIFQQFLELKSETAIARELNRKFIPTNSKEPWNRAQIGRILRNENYIGNLIYNRQSFKLREKKVSNPPDLWIRSEGCLEPIVQPEVFFKVRKTILDRRVDISEAEMLTRLRRTLLKRGRLSPAIINATVGVPCAKTYIDHFGSLRQAYSLVGYTSKRDCNHIDTRQRWLDLFAGLAAQLADAFRNASVRFAFGGGPDCLLVNKEGVSFFLARWHGGEQETFAPHWSIKRRVGTPEGWIVAVRLGERNEAVLDYLLFRTTDMTGSLTRFTEMARLPHGPESFETFDALVKSLIRRLTRLGRASPARPAQRKKPLKSTRSKEKTDHARHSGSANPDRPR
ncbi:recombinase family protein [Bradyrhizobium sp. JYMT SZCCT0428]|nr:recombinase family protein [Bradyrhizobium sp. JYMT SZCCT0428]